MEFNRATVRSIEGRLPEGGESAIAVESHVYVLRTLDCAVRDLVAMGPPILELLGKVPTEGRSLEFCARLRSVVEALGGE